MEKYNQSDCKWCFEDGATRLFDGVIQFVSKTDNIQVDFNISTEEDYNLSNRITYNSGYKTFEKDRLINSR